jgi:hypothetical protein
MRPCPWSLPPDCAGLRSVSITSADAAGRTPGTESSRYRLAPEEVTQLRTPPEQLTHANAPGTCRLGGTSGGAATQVSSRLRLRARQNMSRSAPFSSRGRAFPVTARTRVSCRRSGPRRQRARARHRTVARIARSRPVPRPGKERIKHFLRRPTDLIPGRRREPGPSWCTPVSRPALHGSLTLQCLPHGLEQSNARCALPAGLGALRVSAELPLLTVSR